MPIADDTLDVLVDEIQVVCECGMEVTFESKQGLSRWRGMLFGENGTLLGLCPECEDIRYATAESQSEESAVTGQVVLDEVAMSGEDAASGTTRSFSRRLDELVGLDPDRLTRCSECGACILPDHKQQGPDAPEIGWEYFECPDCAHKMRPESVTAE